MNLDAQPRGRVVVVLSALAVGATLYNWATDFFPRTKYSPDGPPPYAISKETTYITEPLRPDGAVDYVAALNARLSEGVTPDNNAAVLLLEVMGSGVVEPEIREEVYALLGVPVPESTAGALESYSDFLSRQRPSLNEKERWNLHLETFHESYGEPWKRDQFPLVAQWLEKNEQAIDLIVEASDRSRLYFPVVQDNDDAGLSLSLELSSMTRDFARILPSRIMLSIGEGRVEAASRDLLALHRLASLVGSRLGIIDFYVGSAIDEIARAGDLDLARSENVTRTELANHRRELANLQPFSRMSDAFDLYERFYFLDAVRGLIRGGLESADMNPAASIGKWLISCPQQKVWHRFRRLDLDWNLVLTIGNTRIDQAVTALSQPRFQQRIAGLQSLRADVMKLREEAQDPQQISLLIRRKKSPSEVISREFGDELVMSLVFDIAEQVAEAEVRLVVKRSMVIVALALEEFKLDHRTYPDELSELSPDYFESLPHDAFTGRPLKYQKQDAGYLLYSAGPNGQDDRGENDRYALFFDGDDGKDHADDIAIRWPERPDS